MLDLGDGFEMTTPRLAKTSSEPHTVGADRSANAVGESTNSALSLADAIVDRASCRKTHLRLLDIWQQIESDKYLAETVHALESVIECARPYWDLCCALAAYTELCSPERYLEIGVRQGRSAAVVAAIDPDVDIYLFDMWHANYAGVPNPGPKFVGAQLERVGHRGHVHFITGRSQETIPTFFADERHPQTFPLMTVDGDHRDAGARTDLENVGRHLAPGGMLAFDDIAHPEYPTLHRTWQSFVDTQPGLTVRENLRDATGAAIAVSLPNGGL